MQSANAKYINNMRSIFTPGLFRQLLFMIGIVVSVTVGIMLYNSIQEPNYQALDYRLTSKNMASIADTLEKANIRYKVNQQDGIVLVPANQIETARIKLSAAGITKDDSFSFDFLNEQNALANSQFIENARYIRALENDLSKTISGIEGISAARVHIAIPKNNVFADENNRVTASVMLNVGASFLSSKEKVRAIIQIIADSVPGLDPKDVAVTDQYGHFLSEGLDQADIYSTAQLNYQNSVQSYYERRIESMIIPLIGENKVVVRVNANIDYTQQENALENFNPDKTAVLSEQSSSEESSGGGSGGAPGSLSNAPPDGGGAAGGGAGGAQKRSQSTKNFNVSKSVTYKKSNAAQVKSLSVAVVVDNETVFNPKTKKSTNIPLPKEKIDQITKLVQNVIGFNEKRGDRVAVINSVYSPVKELPAPPALKLWEQPWFWDMVKKTSGILLGFIFLFVTVKKLFNHLTVMSQTPSRSLFVGDEDALEDENNIGRMNRMKKQGIEQLKEIAVTDPNKVASIIKTWVRK